MKRIAKIAFTLTLVMVVILSSAAPVFAAGKGNGKGMGLKDRLQDGSCGNVCIYDGVCPFGCDGTGLRDGSCLVCPNNGIPKLDGSGGGFGNRVR